MVSFLVDIIGTVIAGRIAVAVVVFVVSVLVATCQSGSFG